VNENPAVTVREDALRRIRSEFLEMPGLCLTCAQAQRLWGLDAGTCCSLLASLAEDRFLFLRPNGTYARFSDCDAVIPREMRISSHRAAKNFHL